MKKLFAILSAIIVIGSSCQQSKTAEQNESKNQKESLKPYFSGYESQEKWGEHLVTIAGCNDCHTPKKMMSHGPDLDSSLLLSGHPAQMPPPDVNRKEMEKKGLAVTSTSTAWVGPWGISYAANLTSDATGIGNWEESSFIRAMREGKYKGIASSRLLLPPMPWPMYKNMTDGELKAIFAYLKSTEPINNLVPQVQPPISSAQ
ncbi:MAG: diheme cytochrome c-553 [Sediminibacterium sp.]|nr:diheme cytochrome c-553 [Sediminibacterium sp.]